MDKIARLISRAEIQDVMLRYARGVDRRDWPGVQACFHDDATDHHADFNGKIVDFIPWVSGMHEGGYFACHFLGNCLIEFVDDTTAVVETYFIAMLRVGAQSAEHRAMLTKDGGSSSEIDLDVVGRYVDRFEDRGNGWRVAKRQVVFDTIRTRPTQIGQIKPHWAVGTRDSEDPIYAWRNAAGLS